MNIFKGKKIRMGLSKSKILDKEMLIVGNDIKEKTVEEIVKTTDSMKFVASSFEGDFNKEPDQLEEVSKALLRSYDLAVRKISSTYEEIIETKKVISNDFLTIQMMIKNHERNHDIDSMSNIINIFSKKVEEHLAHGKTVKIDEKLIIEPADYVHKMIPIANYFSDNYTNVNIISRQEISKKLYRDSIISLDDIKTIDIFIEAVLTNINNGYYIKLGNLVIAKARLDSPELMILFSKETILRLNKIYTGERLSKRSKPAVKTNYISNFKDSLAKMDNEDQKVIDNVVENEKEGKKRSKKKNQDILDKENKIKAKVEKTVVKLQKNKKSIEEKNPFDSKTPIEELNISKEKKLKNDNSKVKSTKTDVVKKSTTKKDTVKKSGAKKDTKTDTVKKSSTKKDTKTDTVKKSSTKKDTKTDTVKKSSAKTKAKSKVSKTKK